ncbi:MAG: phosphatase PAP2 family protein [Nocardioidaceae bacterium]
MALMTPTERDPARADAPRRGVRAAAAAAVALAAVLGVVVVMYVALETARGQDLDDRAMRVFSENGNPSAARPLMDLLGQATTGSAALALVVFMALALLRRGFALAAAAGVLVAGANLTTQLLKNDLLTRPDLGHGTLNSLPSGHTTLAFSLVLAAILAAPSVLRLAATLVGAMVGTLTGAATVVAGWHRPSDVVVAILVTVAWGAATVAVLALVTPSPARRRARGLVLPALIGSAVAAALLVAWGVGPGSGPGELRAAVVALGTVAVTSAVAIGGFARLVGRALP